MSQQGTAVSVLSHALKPSTERLPVLRSFTQAGKPVKSATVPAPALLPSNASRHVSVQLQTRTLPCRYEDQGRIRPVMHRMSLVEVIVPYGDPRRPFEKKCAYDMVDYGLGNCANSLELGCDCLGHIRYFDGMLCDSKGALAIPCGRARAGLTCMPAAASAMAEGLQGLNSQSV